MLGDFSSEEFVSILLKLISLRRSRFLLKEFKLFTYPADYKEVISIILLLLLRDCLLLFGRTRWIDAKQHSEWFNVLLLFFQ